MMEYGVVYSVPTLETANIEEMKQVKTCSLNLISVFFSFA